MYIWKFLDWASQAALSWSVHYNEGRGLKANSSEHHYGVWGRAPSTDDEPGSLLDEKLCKYT
jgi:hypothetical protein